MLLNLIRNMCSELTLLNYYHISQETVSWKKLSLQSYGTEIWGTLKYIFCTSNISLLVKSVDHRYYGFTPLKTNPFSYVGVYMCIWVRSQNIGCLFTWFCYQLIAKPGNKTATVPWPDPYSYVWSIVCTFPNKWSIFFLTGFVDTVHVHRTQGWWKPFIYRFIIMKWEICIHYFGVGGAVRFLVVGTIG